MDSFLLEFSTQTDLFTYNLHCRLLCPLSLKPQKQHTQTVQTTAVKENLLNTLIYRYSFLSFFLFTEGVTLGEGYEKSLQPPETVTICHLAAKMSAKFNELHVSLSVLEKYFMSSDAFFCCCCFLFHG